MAERPICPPNNYGTSIRQEGRGTALVSGAWLQFAPTVNRFGLGANVFAEWCWPSHRTTLSKRRWPARFQPSVWEAFGVAEILGACC